MAIEKANLDNNNNSIIQEVPLKDSSVSEDYLETVYDDGTIEFDFDEDTVSNAIINESVVNFNNLEHFGNLAEGDLLDEGMLNAIGADVLDRFDNDKQSRAEWLQTVNNGLSLLGLDVEEVDDPFPGACSAHHPMIVEAAVKFQAKASNELFNSKGPVKTAVIGKPTPEKEEQAVRIRNHMNYQIMDQMEEYFDEQERLLFYLPIVGSGFKKTYYCSLLDRPVSEFVPVDEFVVNYYTTSLKTAPCFTHMIHRTSNELLKDTVNGLYREDVELSPSSTVTTEGETTLVINEQMGFQPGSGDDEVYTLLEQYCYLDLEDDPKRDEDGIALPYVVTVEKETGTVLAIRRNWNEDDPLQKMICPFTHYKFVPGMGFYGLGFIHLLGNLQMTLTATMRSLIDSGTFANLQGGFVDKRLRIRSNDGPLGPGEYREVESGGMPLKEAIMPLQFKEPSQTLLAMFQHVEARGQKFADSTEQVVSDSTNYGPVGTTMALLEASTKFFSGVHKRLHKAQKHEFKILASLNYEYLTESESFDIVGDTFEISKDDYDGRIDVVPVSDPNVGSQAQKLSIAQAIYTAALQSPQIHDIREVTREFYSAIGIDEDKIDKFVPNPEEPQQNDPLSDIAMAQQGKPIKAFPGQDHDAHVQIKTAFLQDPMSGANPAMAAITPVIQANIQEHLVLKFQKNVAGTVAQSGQPPSEALLAQAASQVSQTNARLQQLEAQGPDEARNKLANAELHRVMNESRKLESEIDQKAYERVVESMKLQLDKYKTDLDYVAKQMQETNKVNQQQMKEMSDLIRESMKIQQAAKSQERQLEHQQQQQQQQNNSNNQLEGKTITVDNLKK